MWSWYAHGERYLRENSRPPCRQQVRPRSDLLVGRFGWQYDAAKLGLSLFENHQSEDRDDALRCRPTDFARRRPTVPREPSTN
jgi:hypothetical protein